ncbi:MAG: helix-turn-helix domain-containing protein [Patescibacteria group bacterium]
MKNNSSEHLNKMGSIIQRFREKHDLTQKELAKRLNTTQSAVARIESGDQNVSAAMLSKINETLGVNVFQIESGSLTVKIKGGKKLKGNIRTRTSKNGAVGLLCASLLNKGKTTLKDVPRIEEVFRIIEVLESIGVEIAWKNNDLTLEPPKRFSLSSVNEKAARKTRSIIMFLGSLIHHRSSFSLPLAGGCRLGKRNIEPHIFALEDLGVKIEENNGWYKVFSSGLKSGTIVLYESGDTVTENAIMAAACIPEETTIKFASANYQVQEMCFFLKELGVEIEGIGTTTLKIRGVKDINKDISYSLSEDPIESMFFLATAIVTDSSITIERCPIDFLELELLKLEKMGFKYKRSKEYLSANRQTRLVDITTLRSDLKATESKIEPRPYPGLNIDNLPFFAIIATQAEGQTLIHDWVYEERAIYYKELDRLGANTILADPHRIYISGKTTLQPNEVICPPALRPAAIILIGMLGAQGTSILRNIYSINRGYESIIERLNSLGASIEFQPNI